MSLPHALAMLVPESYNDKNPLPAELKSFYEYHSIWMEPWGRPGDRHFFGRPLRGRYARSKRPASGTIPDHQKRDHGHRLRDRRNGIRCLADSREGTVCAPGKYTDGGYRAGTDSAAMPKIKAALAAAHPYLEWLEKNRVILGTIASGRHVTHAVEGFDRMLRVFGYSAEDIERIIKPMSLHGTEPTASMGSDTPIAVLSEKPQRLFNYFRQQFAQVNYSSDRSAARGIGHVIGQLYRSCKRQYPRARPRHVQSGQAAQSHHHQHRARYPTKPAL